MPIPVKTVLDAVINAGEKGSDPQVLALPNGRIMAAFTSAASATNADSFLLAGNATGNFTSGILGPSQLAIDEQNGSVAVFDNGGFIARAWTEIDDATGNADIYAEVVSSLIITSGAITTRFLVNAGATAGQQIRPEVAAFNDKFLVTWVDQQSQLLMFAIEGLNGTQVKAPTILSTSAVGQTFRTDITELASGNLAVTYRSNTSDTKIQIMSQSGGLIGNEIDVDGVSGGTGASSIASLADGRFVVTYGGSGTSISGRIFNVDGTASSGPFSIISGNSDFPAVTALQDGRFMVVAVKNTDIVGQVMTADGTKDGGEFIVNDIVTGSQARPSIDTLADGRVIVAWDTNETGGNQVKSAIFDPRESGVQLAGTTLADEFVGTVFDDVIATGLGDDRAEGGAGNDHLLGGAGNDRLVGGAGGDILDGQGGSDTVDYIDSAAGVVVRLNTGVGVGGDAQGDTLISIENLIGSHGNDILGGSAAINRLDGLDGLDSVDYSASDNRVNVNLTTGKGVGGFAHGDVIVGIDNVIGTAFAADILTGNVGANTLAGLAGDDTLDGGAGFDTADYSASDGRVVVNLSTGYTAGGHAQGDILTAIENLIGTAFANDILTGSVGDNVLVGLAGADTLDGRAGDDTADYSASSARVVVNLVTGQASGGHAQGDVLIGIENLIGSNFGGDILGGSAAVNTLNGLGGADNAADYSASDNRVVINLGTHTAAGGFAQGDTLLNIQSLIGTAFANDLLTGDNGSNSLAGLAEADTLDGLGGSDTADFSASDGRVVVNLATSYAAGGHAQGDTLLNIENLVGSAFDNDILTGNSVNNVFTGGIGADTFVCEGAFGDDIVTDFQDEIDIMRVTGAGAITSQTDTLLGARFTFANGSNLLFNGMTVAQAIDDIVVV